MKNCGSCRFMAAPRREGEKFGRCVRVLFGEDEECDMRKELAYVMDGSGYAASLNVRASFGCVLHEPKATDSPSGDTPSRGTP